MLRLARPALTLVLAVLALLASAVPAAAHGRGSDATNFSSRVVDGGGVPGVTWRVYGGDEYLAVTNDGDGELVVLGYEGEPYLRIGPEIGVLRNALSPATYLNQTRYSQDSMDAVPPEASADAEPRWETVSDQPTYYWTDHRIHWESPTIPPMLTDTTRRTTINEWEVPYTYDGQPHSVRGLLEWVPASSPVPWVAIGLVLALPALAGLRGARGGHALARLARPAAAVLGVVSLLNLVQVVDDLFAVPQPLSASAFKAVQTLLFILVGVFGAVRGWQGREGAFTALGIGSLALFVGQGVLYLSVLTASQTASVFPDAVSRVVVATSLGQLLPVGAVALVGNRRVAAEAPDDTAVAAPTPS